jgi:hypothetical protein
MSAATRPTLSRGRHPSAIGLVIEPWRELGFRHAAAALVLALINSLFASGITLTKPAGLIEYLPAFALRCTLSGVMLVLALTAADHLVDHGAPRLRSFALAAALAAIGASVVSWYLVHALGWPNWFPAGTQMSVQRTQMAFEAIHGLLYNGLGTMAYLHWRDTQAATRLLRSTELRRAQSARYLHQTRLLALQAHVEPELLFAALRQVGALQRTDAAAADALLSELIALLRSLMPAARAADSTVDHEFALALSYLRVVASAVTPLTIEASISTEAEGARLAPMLLQPLLKAVLAAHAGGKPRLLLRADTLPGRLRITLGAASDAGAPFASGKPELALLRARLADLHGANAALTFEPGPALCATLHLPLEHDDRTDR